MMTLLTWSRLVCSILPPRTADVARRRNMRGLYRHARLAAAGRRHRHAVAGIFVELVAQRADRNAENVRGVGAVAQAMLERLEDQVALDVGDGAADQRARHGFGGKRSVCNRR